MRYVYHDLHDLSASELFFWIMVDKTMEQLGVTDLLAVTAILAGQPILPTRTKPAGSTRGTSLASVASRRLLNYRMSRRMPSITGTSPETMKVAMTRNLGAFVGRAVPIVGWFVLASDVVQIVWASVIAYNRIATREDRIAL